MSRTSRAIHQWQIPGRAEGDVRLLLPGAGKRSYRVVWREHGRQREATCLTLQGAHDVGREIAEGLANAAASAPGPSAPFEAAVAHHLDAASRGVTWSVKYQRRMEALVPRWLSEDHLGLPCVAFEGTDGRALVTRLLTNLTDAGYPRGSSEHEQMGALLRGVFASGIDAGYFDTNPMDGLKTSVGSVRNHGGGRFANIRPIGAEEAPPTVRVEEHMAASCALSGRWWEGLPAAVMAFGGLRIEEALALEARHVLVDAPGIWVEQQLLEIRASDGRGSARLDLVPPKSGRQRETFVHEGVWRQLRRRADEVLAGAPDADRATAPLFPSPHGHWQRVDNYRHRVFYPSSVRAGWPKLPNPSAQHRTWLWTPHSLRHHYANWTLKDLGLSPTVVAGYLGHASADITERMYLHRERSDINRGLAAYRERFARE